MSWCQTIADGGYNPGVYCPYTDAAPLQAILQQNGLNVAFWVADPNWLTNDPTEFTVGPTTFPTPDPAVVSDPFTGSGYGGATAWQYQQGYTLQTINGPYTIDLDTSTLFGTVSASTHSPNDFNHDCTSDIFLRNDGGILTDWLMNDGQDTGSGYGYSVETQGTSPAR